MHVTSRDHRGPILFKELVPTSAFALAAAVYIANYIYWGTILFYTFNDT